MMATHVSPYRGSWYPSQERTLNSLLDQLFVESENRTGEYVLPHAIAIIAPHAAPQYSGPVAAAAYRHLQAAKPRRVIILGFSHRGHRRGVAIPALGRYATPLGEVVIDAAAVGALQSAAPFEMVDESAICDHSVEIQLPFLQRAAGGVPVIPLYVGRLDSADLMAAATALARVWQPGDILIASSDLTHYGRDYHFVPFPNDSRISARLRGLDGRAIEAAGSVNGELFLHAMRESGAMACGSQPIALLLSTLSLLGGEEIFAEELDYQTSGEMTGDYSSSVSYAALGYFQRTSFELGVVERAELLLSAQATLARLRQTGGRQTVPARQLPVLARRGRVFVTLRHEGRVVGCVGRTAGNVPLGEAVGELALAAALDDPRNQFGALLPDGTRIEISVLTPMKLIGDTACLRMGVDGAYLECGRRQAVLLPQVASAGWTLDRFVSALFEKAGIDRASPGEPPARIFCFRAQVFGGDLPVS